MTGNRLGISLARVKNFDIHEVECTEMRELMLTFIFGHVRLNMTGSGPYAYRTYLTSVSGKHTKTRHIFTVLAKLMKANRRKLTSRT